MAKRILVTSVNVLVNWPLIFVVVVVVVVVIVLFDFLFFFKLRLCRSHETERLLFLSPFVA